VIKILKKANKIRLFNAMKNKYYLYEVINETPGLTIYDLMIKINWTSGKIHHYIQKLLKDGVIKNSTEIVNERVRKSYFPVSFKELINKDEMTHIN